MEWESGERPEGICSAERWVLGMRAFQPEFSWRWLMQTAEPFLMACKEWAGSTTEERTVPRSGTSCLCFPLESWMGSWVMGLGGQLKKGDSWSSRRDSLAPLFITLVGPDRAARR